MHAFGETGTARPIQRLGIVTDVHYADKEAGGSRFYRDSLEKAREAAELFKQESADMIICIGDLIDAAPTLEKEATHLKKICSVLDESGIPRRHVLGNHCVHTLSKSEFLKHAGLEQQEGHLAIQMAGVTLLLLDACFNSKMEPYQRKNFVWTDTNVPPAQQQWLEEQLKASEQPVIVFVHQRLDLEPDDRYAVKQSSRIRERLEASGKVAAVFQGHSHKNELRNIGGIPYCTIAAMVEGQGIENNAYALLDVHTDGRLTLKGYRKQQDREFRR